MSSADLAIVIYGIALVVIVVITVWCIERDRKGRK